MRRTRHQRDVAAGSKTGVSETSRASLASESSKRLPSWCIGLKKEPNGSQAAYDERVTTSTVTTEIRLRQESIRYWNRRLGEASARAFEELVAPVGFHIQRLLDVKQAEGITEKCREDSIDDKTGNEEYETTGGGVGDDWNFCRALFGLSATTSQSAEHPMLHYPPEVLPVFVIASPMISNCVQDRSNISHALWKQLNSVSSKDTEVPNTRTVCLYIPRLLSCWTETLHLIWDALLYHFENTHEAPAMDADDPRFYANMATDLLSKRHSYHVSKRKHYQKLVDRKVTTATQKSTIGTKKQQSLQDFILEFLEHVFEEPEELLRESRSQDEPERSGPSNPGNLVILLEDPSGKQELNPSGTISTTANIGNRLQQMQLLNTLASWRALHGIPVSLVVLDAVGSEHESQQENLLLNPSFAPGVGGRFGIRMIRCSIPSTLSTFGETRSEYKIPSSLAAALWSHYFLQHLADTPMPLMVPRKFSPFFEDPGFSFMKLCENALQNDASCSTWVESLRSKITTGFYVRKGSFVWDALNPNTAEYMSGPESGMATNKSHTTRRIAENQIDDKKAKDKPPFTIGTEHVNIFYPELVAWFCAYPKAHNLLSAEAGEKKARMSMAEKCDGLLECYRMMLSPLRFPSLSLERPRKKHRGFQNSEPTEDGGDLQYWWSLFCSLLPLQILSLTTTGDSGAIFVSNTSSRQNHRWMLERLAEVYRKLSIKSTSIRGEEGGTSTSASTRAAAVDSHHRSEGSKDFVEWILRRYLQRGRDESMLNSNQTMNHGSDQEIHKNHKKALTDLKEMTCQTILLLDAVSGNHDCSINNCNNDTVPKSELLSGIAEMILQMTKLVLDQLGRWTRHWIVCNPLMLADDENHFIRNEEETTIQGITLNGIVPNDERPINFRRQILNNLPSGPRELYEMLEGRLSVQRDDWFHSFGGTVEEFTLHVYTLQTCGLIRPKKVKAMASLDQSGQRGKNKRRHEIILYEKVPVVWC